MRRSEQREWVFKLIYENSINKIEDIEKSLDFYDLAGEDFIKQSLESYFSHDQEIEAMIKKELGSKFSRLSRVEKSILSLSINEIFYLSIPVSVSINEAVEIAKSYSNLEDYRLINSVLGDIVRKNEEIINS